MKMLSSASFPKIFWGLFAFALLVYLVGAFLHLMEPDATSYALVSMEMYDRGEPWIITLRGYDWLDKPHFQFWVTFLSYHIFGVNDFAYRLPSLLLFMLGVWYTYRFAKRYYDATTGLVAVLMLMSCFHIVVSNSDVRAETLMTGFTIFSLYHMAIYAEEKHWKHLLLGCLGMGIMLMTKGLYTVLPIAAGIGLPLLYRLDFKEIFQPKWILVGILAIAFTLPTLLAYYVQFDLHPEKEFFWGKKCLRGTLFSLGLPMGKIHQHRSHQGRRRTNLFYAYAPLGLCALVNFGLFCLDQKSGRFMEEEHRAQRNLYIFCVHKSVSHLLGI